MASLHLPCQFCLSSEMPINIYRYALQSNGQLLIAANEGENHDADDEEDEDGVVAKILLCDPLKPSSPILKQLVWHRPYDPFFDTIVLLPMGSIVATESHHHMGHGEYGVAIHIWNSFGSPRLEGPSRTIESFPTLLEVGPDVYLTTEVTASILTSTTLILCAVESVMDVAPHAKSHQSSIRAFGLDALEEKWCTEPIPGSIRNLYHIKFEGVYHHFLVLSMKVLEGTSDWALTVSAIDEVSGAIRRTEILNYKVFGRRRLACGVANTETSSAVISMLFDDGSLCVVPLTRFIEDGLRDLVHFGSQLIR
ncbi:hypothetical protein BDP27DRAFT_648097 [Rhodocollybia butyracea]|uniref:Uncharacterized protein n=1 Tax=Rhodocollybia butyracea TaxID=206335 RepID=A0A9P5PVP8_9AGAR|nr:hypothetical protein BDP27DRAFT_648097 [Rhodocollybia butyracea]